MRETKSVFRILTLDGVVFEIITLPEQEQETLDYCQNLYYKSRIETFWINDVEWQEPELMLNS